MALVFNNDMNSAIMSDMAWNIGGLLGRGIPAGLGFGAKALGGYRHKQNLLDSNEYMEDGTTLNPNYGKKLIDSNQFLEDGTTPNPNYNKPMMEEIIKPGFFGAPTKDVHGIIPIDKWSQGIFGKKAGDATSENEGTATNESENASGEPVAEWVPGTWPNAEQTAAAMQSEDDVKINELETIAEEDPVNIANNTEMSKLKNKREAVTNAAKKLLGRYQWGDKWYKPGPWMPGKLAGGAVLGTAGAIYNTPGAIYGGIRDNIIDRRVKTNLRREEKANMKEQELLTGSLEEKQGLLQKIFKGGKKKETKNYGSGVSEYIPADVSEEENIAANIQETGEGMATSEMIDNYAPELQDLNFPGPASEEQLQEVMDSPEDYRSGESLYVPPKASTYRDNYNAQQDKIRQLEQGALQNNEPPISLLERARLQEQLDRGLDNYDSTLAVDTGALDNVDTSNIQPIETDPNMHLSFPENNIGGPLGGALGGALNPETTSYDSSGKPQPGYTKQGSKIATSPYYDSTLSIDSGALDGVNTSNIQPINYDEPDSLGNRNNNPGNIKFADQKGAVKEGDFAKFETKEDGWRALYKQIDLDASRGDTISTFIKGKDGTGGYSEDNQESYISFISERLGVPPNTPISQLDRQQLVSAIAIMEGNMDNRSLAPPLEQLAPQPQGNNRNVLDAIIQKGIMPIDMDSIIQQNLQQQEYRRKMRGY